MQPRVTHRTRSTLILLLAIVAIVGFVWIGLQSAKFHITGTDPGTNKVALISPYIRVNFNKQLSSTNLSISADPKEEIKSYSAKNTVLQINLNTPLHADTTYTITIRSISSTSGSTLTNQIIKFTPQDIDYQDLSKEQQQAIMQTQVQRPAAQSDPILSHLPHGTLDFNLEPTFTTDSNGKTTLVLEATILPSAADVRGGEAVEQAAVDQYKQEVIDYIKSLKLDPASYTIDYKVVPTSQF